MHFICIVAFLASIAYYNESLLYVEKVVKWHKYRHIYATTFCSVKLPLCLCNVYVNAAKTFRAKIVGCHFEVVIRFAHCPIK